MNRWIFALAFLLLTSVLVGCVAPAQPTAMPSPTSSSVPPSPTTEPTELPTATPNFPQPTLRPPLIPQGTVPPNSIPDKLIADAKADLATRVNVAADAITVASTEPAEWSDGSMGCPQPGMMYPQMVTSGYKIILQAAGKQYEYHGSNFGIVYCESH